MKLEEEIKEEEPEPSLRESLGILGILSGSMVVISAILSVLDSPFDRFYALISGKSYETFKQESRNSYIEREIEEIWKYDLDKNEFLDRQEYQKFVEDKYDNNPRNK